MHRLEQGLLVDEHFPGRHLIFEFLKSFDDLDFLLKFAVQLIEKYPIETVQVSFYL
jgi:hypothetical protein